MTAPERRRIYAGWGAVAACFACSVVVVGSTIYSFGFYVLPVGEEFGLSRAEANIGMIIFLSAMALWSPIIGSAIDRFPAPAIVATGGALFAAGLVTIARSASLAGVVVAIAGPIACSMAAAGPLAAATVVARWFRRRRGRAMGMVAVSTAAGGALMTPIVGRLIPELGWRTALEWTGLVGGGVIAILAIALIRSRPSEAALRAAGEIASEGDPDAGDDAGSEWTTSRLVATRNFWLIALGCGTLLASDGAILISKIPYLLDLGIELPAASFLVACQSVSAVVGKLAVGLASERVDLRKLFALVAGAHLVMLGALIAEPGYWTLLVVFSCVGIAVGGVHPIFSTLIATCFGSRSYGAVHGRINVVTQPLSLGAIYFVGVVYDGTGSYTAAFWAFGAGVFLATLLIALVERPAPAMERRLATA